MKIIYLIISLIFPIIFLYPQGLLYGTYINYIYVFASTLLLFLIRKTYNHTYAMRFILSIFLLNLYSNAISLLLGYINIKMMVNGNAPLFTGVCISFIISNFPTNKLHYLGKSIIITFILTLLLILLDGITKPVWIYSIFYTQNNDIARELVNTIHHRAVGSLLTPIMSGFFCATIMTYSFVRIIHSNRYKSFYIMALGISTLSLLLTASRTVMLAFAFMLIYYFIIYNKKKKIWLNMIIVSSIIMIYVSIADISFMNNTFENIKTRNEQLSGGIFQGTGRMATLLSALRYKLGFRSFLGGIGTAEYSIVEDSKYSLAHNGFLSVFLPLGLLGVIFYFMMFKRYIICTMRNNVPVVNMYVSMWSILSLGTLLSADLPVSYFYIALQAITLTFMDRINESNYNRYMNEILHANQVNKNLLL